MIYKIIFEHHYSNDTDWYWEHKVLIKTSHLSEIENLLKERYPNGYINILTVEEFHLNEDEIFDITNHCGAVG